jgi:hypothetical protein
MLRRRRASGRAAGIWVCAAAAAPRPASFRRAIHSMQRGGAPAFRSAASGRRREPDRHGDERDPAGQRNAHRLAEEHHAQKRG